MTRGAKQLSPAEKRRARLRLRTSEESLIAVGRAFGVSEIQLRIQVGRAWYDEMLKGRFEARGTLLSDAKSPEERPWEFCAGRPMSGTGRKSGSGKGGSA